MKKLILPLIALSLTTVHCTKTRQATFDKGSGENLLKVQDYNEKSFEIVTFAANDADHKTTYKDHLNRQFNIDYQDEFAEVKFEVKGSDQAKLLLKDITIVGRPNFKYEGKIEITNDRLNFYKISLRKDIPFHEQIFAKKLEDNKMGVLLLSYNLTDKVSVESQMNDKKKPKNKLSEMKQEDIKKATHFRIDQKQSLKNQISDKGIILSKEFLHGEWLLTHQEEMAESNPEIEKQMEVSKVEANKNKNSSEVMELGERVSFKLSEKSADLIFSTIEKKASGSNLDLSLKLPLTWKNFSFDAQGKESEDSQKNWNESEFAILNLSEETSLRENESGKILKVEITDTSIILLIENSHSHLKTKVSLYKQESVQMKQNLLKNIESKNKVTVPVLTPDNKGNAPAPATTETKTETKVDEKSEVKATDLKSDKK